MSEDLYNDLIRRAFEPPKCGQFFKSNGQTYTCVVEGQHTRHVSGDNKVSDADHR